MQMSNVRVEVAHSLSPSDIPGRLATFSQDLSKVGAKLVWKGTRADVSGIGVSGDVSAEPGKVIVNLKLGMMARAAGVDPVRLEASIRRKLEAALSG